MTFADAYRRMNLPAMTHNERRTQCILVVDPDNTSRQILRQILTSVGFTSVVDAADHTLGLAKLQERKITHTLFDAKATNISAKEFLTRALEFDDQLIAIPVSGNPTVDDVFNLLVIGARGYLVKPFFEQSVEDAIVMATKGEQISDAILYAKDRNQALASLIMASLDKLALLMRQADRFETAKREIPHRTLALRRAVDIGRTFAVGGPDGLLISVIEQTLERATGPASRLGRTRRRISERKPAAAAIPGLDELIRSSPAEDGQAQTQPNPAAEAAQTVVEEENPEGE